MKGISYDKSRNRWVCRRTEGGETKLLGRYKTEEEAIQAYQSSSPQQPISSKKIKIYHEGKTVAIDPEITLSREHEGFLCDVCVEKGFTSFSEPIAKLIAHAIKQRQ